MKIAEVLKKNGITIEEKSFNVIEYRDIDINTIKNEFKTYEYKASVTDHQYDSSKVKFNILKDGDIILDSLTEKEVQEYIEKLVKEDDNST